MSSARQWYLGLKPAHSQRATYSMCTRLRISKLDVNRGVGAAMTTSAAAVQVDVCFQSILPAKYLSLMNVYQPTLRHFLASAIQSLSTFPSSLNCYFWSRPLTEDKLCTDYACLLLDGAPRDWAMSKSFDSYSQFVT